MTENLHTSRMMFQWVQLVVISSGVFLSSLDVTVNVALPLISDYFDAEPRTVYLMITFYLGTGVALQLGVGRAGDLFGLRNVFLVGLVSYTTAMIAIGLSPTIESVILFRILQAVGNAALLAIAPALATSLFPGEMRGRALGVMTAIGTLGMVVGTLSAGLMLEYVSWHWIFLGRLPICLISTIGTIVLLKEIGRNTQPKVFPCAGDSKIAGRMRSFDFMGAISVFAAVVALVAYLNVGAVRGWIQVESIPLLIISLGLWTVFLRRQTTVKSPLLKLQIFKNIAVSAGVGSNLLLNMGTFVNVFILPYFASEIMGVSPVTLGIFLMLSSVAISMCSPVGGYISDRIGPGLVTVVGMLVVTTGLASFTMLSEDASVTEVAVRMLIVGAGMGIFQSANLSLIMGGVTTEGLGMGGALSAISRGMGSVTAVAVMGGIFASIYSLNSSGVGILSASATHESVNAYVAAFRIVYWVATALTALGVVTSFLAWKGIGFRR